jgi:GntR family transcriptional regulator
MEIMTQIERESPIPLYFQLKRLLVERIASGMWRPGDLLPTEEQLQEQYGLSRTTVRQAMKEMEMEGLITRQRGRGTFVAKPKFSHSPTPQHNLASVLLEQGAKPGWQVLSAGMVPASDDVAARLQLTPGAMVYCLRRLRMADDEAIGYHITHVAAAFQPAIDELQLTGHDSLQYLRSNGLLDGSRADRILEAIPAPDDVAGLLEVEPGSPMLMIRRLLVSHTGVPIEDMRAMYRGDSFRYQIRNMTEG